MSQILAEIAARASDTPNGIAISDRSYEISYNDLTREIGRVSSTLRSIVCTGPVALVLDNCPAWALVDLAAIGAQIPLLPLPSFFTPQQTQFAMQASGANWELSDTAGSGAVEVFIADRRLFLTPRAFASRRLPAGTAKLTFTSGSTGHPKGVCLSVAALEKVASRIIAALGRDRAGLHLPILPLSVLLENVAGLYPTLMAGGHYRVLGAAELGLARPFQPDPGRLAQAVAEQRAETMILVPQLLRALMAGVAGSGFRTRDLQFIAVGGAKTSPKDLSAARRAGIPAYEGYGLTEAGSVVTLNTPEADRIGSVGRALEPEALAISASGEILLRNSGFLGYADGEVPPAIYPTGDLGELDADGFLYIRGRKSNTIITSFGRNISPEWIESELTESEDIRQAVVFGEGAPKLSALVVPTHEHLAEEVLAGAIETANAKLPEYAHIASWRLVAEFSVANNQLTANGRLRRSEIEKQHGTLMNQLLRASLRDGFFNKLVLETESSRQYLRSSEQLKRGLAGQIATDTYIRYLAEAYHHVSHTVPLMELALSRLPNRVAFLSDTLLSYIQEESGHEEWILDDISNAGGDAAAVRANGPGMATEFMISYAYDFITRINPVGLFGMIFVLESTSTALATTGAAALMQSLKLPQNCFRYLTSHGALDLEHMRFFEEQMLRIEEEQDQRDIIHMAQRMFILFANLFRSIPLE